MKQTQSKQQAGGSRPLGVRVRKAKGRKISSHRWLSRQLNDPYVFEAQRQGFRSRSAFKLIELNEKYNFLKPGKRVVDLGAAPGGWTQIATEKVGAKGQVIAIDLMEMDPITGAITLCLDFLDETAEPEIKRHLKTGQADIVLSDMAAPSTGHAPTDHIRIMALAESAYEFAKDVLASEGTFITKVLQGGTEKNLLGNIKRNFTIVKHVKPPASRKGSAEMYLVALGFKG